MAVRSYSTATWTMNSCALFGRLATIPRTSLLTPPASRALLGTAPRECGVRSKPGSARVRRRRVSAAPPEPRRSSGRCRRGDAPRNRGRKCIRSCRCAPPRRRANPYYNIRNWDVKRAFIPLHRGCSRQNSGRLCVLSTVYHRFDPVAIDQHSGSLENRTFPEHGIVTRPAALKQPPLTLRYARMALT